jgi:hypothetical protein
VQSTGPPERSSNGRKRSTNTRHYISCIHTHSRAPQKKKERKEEASYIYVYYKYQTGRKRVASSILREEKRGEIKDEKGALQSTLLKRVFGR